MNERGNRGYSSNYQNRNFDNKGYARQGQVKQSAESKFESLNYKREWLVNGASPEMIEFAEQAGKFMASNNLTNSKIRSIYGEIKRIQMVDDFDKVKSSFYLLKPKVAYALGRDDKNEGLKLFKLIFDKCFLDVNKETYKNFCNLIEAILAYHKANGGKD